MQTHIHKTQQASACKLALHHGCATAVVGLDVMGVVVVDGTC